MTCPKPFCWLWQRMPWNLGLPAPHPAFSLLSPPWPTWFLAGQAKASSPSDAPKSPHTQLPMHQLWGCSGWSRVPRGDEEGAVPDPKALPHCREQSPEPRHPGQRVKAAGSLSGRPSHFLIYLVNILVPQSVKSIT